ncbi:MAG: hypothetical protein JOZ81_03190 [Chloroflexi bacterium]|nr:hypothetical protein [Chloroflexota bacterium]
MKKLSDQQRRRPTEPHAACCRHCPSAPGRSLDPEAADILASTDAMFLREMLFPCGWRPEKLCRGNWDQVQARLRQLEARGLA